MKIIYSFDGWTENHKFKYSSRLYTHNITHTKNPIKQWWKEIAIDENEWMQSESNVRKKQCNSERWKMKKNYLRVSIYLVYACVRCFFSFFFFSSSRLAFEHSVFIHIYVECTTVHSFYWINASSHLRFKLSMHVVRYVTTSPCFEKDNEMNDRVC